jgi:hypothetical protein
MGFKVARYDDDLFTTGGYNRSEYINNITEFADFFFKKKADPSMGWAVPFVTGHKYRIQWGSNLTSLDFTEMKFALSEEWTPTDKSIYFVHPWIDVRAKVEVRLGGSNGDLIDNNTIIQNNINNYTLG